MGAMFEESLFIIFNNQFRFHVRHECEPGSVGDGPCIVDVLADMVLAVTESLEKNGLNHFISYGTLLGAARNQSIIPWTTDIDIVIDEGNWTTMPKIMKNSKILAKNGLKFFFDPVISKNHHNLISKKGIRKRTWSYMHF